MDTYYGEIRLLPYGYVPQNWLPCDGRQLPINAYQALYAVIGMTYGGNIQQSVFNLPDLRGQAVVGYSPSAPGPSGLHSYPLNQKIGQTSVALTVTQVPSHNHTLSGKIAGAAATSALAAGSWLSHPVKPGTSGNELANCVLPAPSGNQVSLNAATLSAYGGGGKPHENRQPYLAMQYCICIIGEIFPVRP